jgi:methionine synthase II (cobalamin-independent)
VPGYDSVEEAVDHMLQILRGLITDTIEAGAKYIQLDYPSYVYLVDRNAVAKLTEMGHDLGALLDTWIDLDRRVLADMPEDVHFSMHICRGNYKSYWMFEGPWTRSRSASSTTSLTTAKRSELDAWIRDGGARRP